MSDLTEGPAVATFINIGERTNVTGSAKFKKLILAGDFDAALGLIDVIATSASKEGTKERRQHAMIAIDMIVAGPMMQHIVIHLASVDDTQFERIKTMCLSLGEVLVRPLVVNGELRSMPIAPGITQAAVQEIV